MFFYILRNQFNFIQFYNRVQNFMKFELGNMLGNILQVRHILETFCNVLGNIFAITLESVNISGNIFETFLETFLHLETFSETFPGTFLGTFLKPAVRLQALSAALWTLRSFRIRLYPAHPGTLDPRLKNRYTRHQAQRIMAS